MGSNTGVQNVIVEAGRGGVMWYRASEQQDKCGRALLSGKCGKWSLKQLQDVLPAAAIKALEVNGTARIAIVSLDDTPWDSFDDHEAHVPATR